jgi:hypothetical protein
MKVSILDEPHLEFLGGSRHIDPRSGSPTTGRLMPQTPRSELSVLPSSAHRTPSRACGLG